VTRQAGLVVGYVPQRLAIDRTLPMTVRRFLSLPKRVTGMQRPAAAWQRVGVPDVAGRQMADLSGGQFQRVLLARALLARPDILILDEPTQGLDQPGEAAFYRLIEEVRRETGVAVLMVSHDLHVVMAASDRVICLNGHICCEGTPRWCRPRRNIARCSGWARKARWRCISMCMTTAMMAGMTMRRMHHDHHDHDHHHA
jgi:zinc transport system ATP-binding protein